MVFDRILRLKFQMQAFVQGRLKLKYLLCLDKLLDGKQCYLQLNITSLRILSLSIYEDFEKRAHFPKLLFIFLKILLYF